MIWVLLAASAAWFVPQVQPADAAAGYRIQSGDTLGGLHQRFHRSVRCLAKRNHIRNPDIIVAGRMLVVPTRAWCHGHRHHAHRSQRPSRSGIRKPLTNAQTAPAFKAWARAHVAAGQFGALDALWTHESGWNRYAQNTSSGAYGIPQALPGSKMASAGSDWTWNGYTQMRWGLSYIRGRYGCPAKAWAFWQQHNWY